MISYDDLVKIDRVHSSIFTSPEIFTEEMKQIFYKTWVYVGYESEIPNPGDYKLTRIGMQSVIIVRAKDGSINALVNACRHRGVTLCQLEYGNAKNFVCAYHGWGYNLEGDLKAVPHLDAYPSDFDLDQYGLHRVPKVGSHSGFIFASLNQDAPSLIEHLGASAKYLTLFADLSPSGRLKVQNGCQKYSYPGNWKAQIENSVDGYHGATVHGSYFSEIVRDRLGTDILPLIDGRSPCLSRELGNGHAMLDQRMIDRSSLWAKSEKGDVSSVLAEYMNQLIKINGKARAEEILKNNGGDGYNLLVYPNLVLIGVQIRVIQPVAFNKTEVYVYPTFLEDVSDEINLSRLRAHEDFYGPASFGTPDDVEMFVRQWDGLQGGVMEWLLYNKGLGKEQVDEDGRYSNITDETAHRGIWKKYKDYMTSRF